MNQTAANYKLVHWIRLALLKSIFPQSKKGNLMALANHRLVEFPEYLITTAYKQPDLRNEEPFSRLAGRAIASRKTLLNYDRLYTLYNAIQSAKATSKGRHFHAVEIGVFKGGGSRFIAETLALHSTNKLSLDCFDTFAGHNKQDLSEARDRLDVHTTKVFQDTSLEAVETLLKPFSFAKCHPGRFEDSCAELEAATLDFVHLDVDLHGPTLHALKFLLPRTRPGGCIIVDDYRFVTCPGAKEAVDEFIHKNTDNFGIPLLTGQYLIVKSEVAAELKR